MEQRSKTVGLEDPGKLWVWLADGKTLEACKGLKSRRDDHGAVLLLKIFKDRGEGPTDGDTGPV